MRENDEWNFVVEGKLIVSFLLVKKYMKQISMYTL